MIIQINYHGHKQIIMVSLFNTIYFLIQSSNEHLHISKPPILLVLSILLFTGSAFGNSSSLKTKTDHLVTLSNGAIAYAYPVSNIKIDGDITDWPKDFVQYPIKHLINNNGPKDKTDFDAYFRVGYNLTEQALYLVVVVTDDSHVILSDTKNKGAWKDQDSFSLFIDKKHSPDGSGVDLYKFSEHFRKVNNQSISWDPTMKETSWDDIEIISKRKGNITIYECKVALGNQFVIGKSIGIDYIIVDKDTADKEGAESRISWGKNGGKSSKPGRLGDVILMRAKEKTGAISGKLVWKDLTVKGYPNLIRCTSTANPTLWTQVTVDSTGQYTADLPVGDYTITPVRNIHFQKRDAYRIDTKNTRVAITVAANKKVEAPVLELATIPNPDTIPEKGILHDFDPKNPVAIDQFIKTYQEHYQIPGVSLALIKEGKLAYHKTYGVKNTYTQEKVNDKTLFEAASITKPVFGFAVMRLAERKVIDLDKPLHEYLPFEDIAHDERYKLITARHVMTHQTGFPNWAWMNEDNKINIKFTPGTSYGYSGEGFEYLKRVVAHITKKDINDLLKEEVLTQLGLENTYFSKNDYLAKVVANGHYDNLPSQRNLPDAPGMAWSMHTEAKTFTNFLLGLSDKKGLKSETYKEMFTTHTEIPRGENDPVPEEYKNYFGLAISIQKSPFGLAFGHGGNNGDFKCLALMYQDLDMGFVVFTNSNTGDRLHMALTEYLVTGKRKKSQ